MNAVYTFCTRSAAGPEPSTTPFSVSFTLSMTQMKPWSSYSLTMVGKTFSRRVARDFRSKGFSVLDIWAMAFPFRKTLWETCPASSFASAMARLKLSGMMPMSVPVNVFPVVVVTVTVLSTSAAISVKNFLCATDNFNPPLT